MMLMLSISFSKRKPATKKPNPPQQNVPVPPTVTPVEEEAKPEPEPEPEPKVEETEIEKQVRNALLSFLREQLFCDADIYKQIVVKLEAGEITTLRQIQQITKPSVLSCKTTAFDRSLTPLLQAINGERFDKQKAIEGFSTISKTQLDIASRIDEALTARGVPSVGPVVRE